MLNIKARCSDTQVLVLTKAKADEVQLIRTGTVGVEVANKNNYDATAESS